ncbi:hypothetical protein GW17_00003264 [Ensete ventricosum]|nr:hypothetical protein GW17_00003264 [Ensete ventricosum]
MGTAYIGRYILVRQQTVGKKKREKKRENLEIRRRSLDPDPSLRLCREIFTPCASFLGRFLLLVRASRGEDISSPSAGRRNVFSRREKERGDKKKKRGRRRLDLSPRAGRLSVSSRGRKSAPPRPAGRDRAQATAGGDGRQARTARGQEVRSVAARALGSLIRGMGEENFPDLVSWLLETLKSDSSNVERSGAAQGLSEVLAALGNDYFERILPDIIRNCSHIRASVRDGHLTLFKVWNMCINLSLQVAGTSGKATLEGGSDDEGASTEAHGRAIIDVLGNKKRNEVLAAIYMVRSDVSLTVRQVRYIAFTLACLHGQVTIVILLQIRELFSI